MLPARRRRAGCGPPAPSGSRASGHDLRWITVAYRSADVARRLLQPAWCHGSPRRGDSNPYPTRTRPWRVPRCSDTLKPVGLGQLADDLLTRVPAWSHRDEPLSPSHAGQRALTMGGQPQGVMPASTTIACRSSCAAALHGRLARSHQYDPANHASARRAPLRDRALAEQPDWCEGRRRPSIPKVGRLLPLMARR
jgi:hypothetical protein